MPHRRDERPATRVLPPAPARRAGGALVFTPPTPGGGAAASTSQRVLARATSQHRALVGMLRATAARLLAEADALEQGLLPTEATALGSERLVPAAERIDHVRVDLALANTCIGTAHLLAAIRTARALEQQASAQRRGPEPAAADAPPAAPLPVVNDGAMESYGPRDY